MWRLLAATAVLGLAMLPVPSRGVADVTGQAGDSAYEVQPLNEASIRRGETPALMATAEGPKRGRGMPGPGRRGGGDKAPALPDPDDGGGEDDDGDDDTAGGETERKFWDASGEEDAFTPDEKGSPAWDPKVAKDFLDPANYRVKSKPAPCPKLTATTTMPLGTGLAGCNPALSAAQCSLLKLGTKALSMDQQCFGLANKWSTHLARINRKSNATEAKYELVRG